VWAKGCKGLALLLVALAVLERLTVVAHAPPTTFDDAYTYLRYARHWLAGGGLAWNLGEGPVYGVTSLLHLALVTAVAGAWPALPAWRVLQVASGTAAIALLAALAAMLAGSSRHGRLRSNLTLWSAVVVVTLAFPEAFVFHATTGMDTMLAALANTALVFCSLELAAEPSLARVALVLGTATVALLARPENVICATLCPALALLLLGPSQARGPIRAGARPAGRRLRNRVRWVASYWAAWTAVVVMLGFAAAHWLGSPVPLSFFAKQPHFYAGFAGELGWNPFRFLVVFLQSIWPFLLALVLFGDRVIWRLASALLGPALLTIALLFHFNQIMGHLGRFYYPMLPFFVAAGGLTCDRWLVRRGWALRRRALCLRVGLAILIVLGLRAGLTVAADHYDGRDDGRAAAQDLPALASQAFAGTGLPPLPDLDSWQAAHWVARLAVAAPAGTTFAMSEHGLPGALAPQIKIIDVLGLHDPWFARHGFSVSELFRRQPDVIWLPHPDHAEMLRLILTSAELAAHYDFYPDAFYYGLALRREGQHASRLAALLGEVWRAAYPGFPMADYRARGGD
jgi:hypothetical protein